jgi:subtilase family serine protease
MKLLVFALLIFGAFQSSWAGGLSTLPNHVPSKKIARSTDLGRRPSTDKMHLAVTLALKDPAGLDDFVKRVYDSSDPLFHQFLSADQFAENFAPEQSDLDEVTQYLTSQNLTITKVHSNRMVIDVSGSVAEIENAFQTEVHNYVAKDGRIVSSITSDPVVPDAIATHVNGIVGLNNFSKYKKFLKQQAEQGHMTVTQANAYMTPAKIKSMYGFGSVSQTGTGESLALFELDGYTASDITAYASEYSLTEPTLTNKLEDSATGTPSTGADSGADEVTLDIEMALALAPGLTKIYVYEGPPQTDGMTQSQADTEVIDIYNAIASDNLAKTVSTSWGEAENEVDSTVFSSEYNAFYEMAAQGQSMFAAAGDSGAYDDSPNGNNTTLEVDDPCSQPYVTCTGGTKLSNTTGPSYPGETSWTTTLHSGTFGNENYTPDEGAGGGISTHWSNTSQTSYDFPWQAGLATSANKGSSTMRMVPDVSLNADPQTGYAVYYDGAWTVFGGTSCVAPLYAAFTALVNEGRVAESLTRVGFLNPILYQAAQSPFYSSDFNDIHDGSTNLYYPAETGYDLTTGWGSLNGGGLYTALTTIPPAPPANLTASVVQ